MMQGSFTISDSTRVAALDGVRGLAILLVMSTHFTLIHHGVLLDRIVGAVGRLGWSGVDLFFVLSGYLITSILLQNRDKPNYFRNFYARRILRIFPLYYFVVFVATVVMPLIPFISQQPFFRPVSTWTLPMYWFYLSNIPVAFTQEHMHDVLAITWSLAIEEQYYMVWPWVVKRCSLTTLKRLCLSLAAVSLISRMVAIALGADKYPPYAFTLCRMDPIALGSLLAVMVRQRGFEGLRRLRPATGWLAAACIGVLIWCAISHKTTGFVGAPGQTFGYTAFAILYWCVLLATLTSPKGTIINWFFTRRWLIFLGRYSYAIYLFHMPIHRVMREWVYPPEQFATLWGSRIPGQLIFYVLCAVPTIVVALLSWHLLEKHCLKLKRFFPTEHAPVSAEAK